MAKIQMMEAIIEAFSPATALKRERQRTALTITRKYEGASIGRRTDGWTAQATSANSEIGSSITILRARSRQLARDNDLAAAAVSLIANNIVGFGIRTVPVTSNKTKTARLNTAWKKWAESTQCDFNGEMNLAGMQNLVARGVVEAGEMLVRRRRVGAAAGLVVPVQLQVLEPDFMDLGRRGEAGGSKIFQGIQFDSQGRKEGYWLFDHHPGDTSALFGNTYTSSFVSAADILHIKRVDRAGQVHGVPWCAPVIVKMRDADEYQDAELVRQKIAACFTGVIHDSEMADLDPVAVKDQLEMTENVEPGAFQFLPPGKTITFGSPPTTAGYVPYMSDVKHSIATGYGVPYEELTGDYSQVTFSSARMGRNKFNTNLDHWQWNMFIPQMCQGTWDWWAEAAMLMGLPTQDATCKHITPKRTLVDETREIPAIIAAVRAGLKTLPQGVREAGEDWEDQVKEIAEANALLDENKIILDTDPRKVTMQGIFQMEPEPAETPPGGA